MANQIRFNVGYTVDKTGLSEVQAALKQVQNEAQKASLSGNLTPELKEASKAAKELEKILNQSWNGKIGQLDLSKVNNGLRTAGLNVKDVQQSLSKAGVAGAEAFNKISSTILSTNLQLKNSNKLLDNMATTMANTVKWGVASSIMNSMTGSIQQAWGYTKSLDSSLNDIMIVTGKSADEMDRFAVQANKAAKELAAGTTDYTNAALIYYQQGLSDQEVAARAEVTLKAANVTGQDTAEVSEQLTAVWNGYKVQASEAELYVDKLAAVAATTASDLEELSVGMSKVASAASIMGVDIDQLNATLATVVSVTRQAPESVGTAFKTIYARMGDIEAGLDTETTLGAYTEKMKEIAGINVLDTNNQLRDMGDVIEEVGNNWNNLSREQQIALSQVMAGTRQYNNLLSLFDNWDMYTNALETSADAAGTLQKQQDIYMESTVAHLQQLSTEAERTYSILFNTDTINDFVDAGTGALSIFNNFLESLGGGMDTFTMLGTIGANVFNKQIGEAIEKQIVNMQILKQNQEALETVRGIAKNGPDVNIDSQREIDAYKAQAERQAELLALTKNLSTEEYNRLTDLNSQITALELQSALLEDYLDTQKDSLDSVEKITTEQEKRNNQIKNEKKAYDELIKVKQQIQKYDMNESTSKQDTINFIREQTSLEEYVNQLTNNNLLTENQRLQIRQAYDNLMQNGLQDEQALNTILSSEEILLQKLKVSREELNALLQIQKAIEDGNVNAIQQQLALLKQRIQYGGADENGNHQLGINNHKQQQNIQETIQGLTSLAMATQSVTSAITVLKNKDLTPWEKFTQIGTNLLFMAPMLISSFKILATSTLPKFAVAIGAVKTGTDAATMSFTKLTAAIMTNPIGIAIVALTTAVSALAIYSDQLEKAKQKQIELNKATYDTSKTLSDSMREETNVIADLYQNYINMKSHLDETEESKENLKTATEELCEALGVEWDILDKLQGKYDNVNNQILEQQKAKILETIKASQETIKAANDVMEDTVDSVVDEYSFGHSTGMNTDGSVYDKIYTNIEVGLSTGDEEKVLDTMVSWLSENYGDIYDKEGSYNAMHSGEAIRFNEGVTESEAINVLSEFYKFLRDNSEDLGISTQYAEDSEAYQWFKTLYNASDISNLASDIDSAQSSIDENILLLADIEGQLFNSNNDPSKITTDEELNTYKEAYIEQLKSVMEELEIDTTEYTEEYFSNLADQYLSGFDNLNTLLENQDIEISLKEKLGTSDEVNSFLENVKNEDGLRILAQVNLDEMGSLEAIKSEYQKIKNEVELDAIQIKIEVNTKAQKEINSEDGLTEDTRKELSSIYGDAINWTEFDLSTPIEQLKILNELQYEHNSGLLDNYEDNLKLIDLEKERVANAEALKTELERLREVKADLVTGGAPTADIKEVESQIEEIEQQLELLDGQKIEINVDFKTTQLEIFENTVNSILSEAEALKTVTELIGEGFIVAKEDAEQFASIYPALLENAQVLADGQIQLNSGVVQAIMHGNSAILTSDAGKTEGLLENQLALLDAEIAYQKTVITNLQNYIAGTQTAEETKANIKQAAAEFESGLTEGLTNEQLEAFNAEIAGSETSTNVALQNLDEIGLRVAAVSEAYSKMLTGEQVSYTPGGATGIGGDVGDYNSSFNPDDYTDKSLDGSSAKALLEQAQAELDGLLDTRAEYTELLSKLKSGTNESYEAMNGAAAGTGGQTDDKGDSKEKEKDPDYIEQLEDEIDRYHDINIELEQISTNLSRLEKEEKKLFGKELLDNLNEQLEVLKQQNEAYETKLALAKQEAAEIRGMLSGVDFNDDGTIANYAAALQAKQAYVNSLINQYNAMSAEEQESFKAVVDAAKEDYEEFKSQIERYDDLISSEIPDLEDNIQDALDKEIEIQIKKFTMEVEIHLDMAEAEKDFNEFKRKVIDGIKDDDILGNAKADLKDLESYFNTNGTGIGPVQALTNQVEKTLEELAEMENGGTSDVYGDNKAQALEDLKTYYTELMGQLEEVEKLSDQIKESYLDMIDETIEEFDKQIDQYEYINDLINHDMNLIGLLYGEDAYAEMDKYYRQMEANNNKELDFLKKRVAYAYEMMQAETDPEAKEKWQQEWQDSLSELNSKVEDSVQNIIDMYSNSINKVFDELNDKITNGLGLDYINDEWDLINQNAEQYLDTVNSMYAIQDLENKYLEALDATDSIGAQQKLNDLMNEQLAALREKDKLTQYDVDRANMLYDIALKEIALQNAQQNKSKMRLRRDSQGNYSYQYVSDEDSIAQAQQELLAAQNDLYNLDKDQYKNNLDQIYSTYAEFQEKLKALYLDQTLTAEERAVKEAMLVEQYGELINGLVEQNETIRNNLQESTFQALAAMYEVDVSNFTNMSNAEQEILMESMIPTWDSSIQHMADTFAGEGGFIPTCTDAFEELRDITADYQQSLDDLEAAAGVDFDSMASGYDENISKAEELLWANDDLIAKYQEQISAIQDVMNEVAELIAKYEEARAAAEAATEAAYAYWQAQQQAAAEEAANDDGGSGGGSGNNDSGGGSGNSGGGSSGGGSSGGSGDGTPKVGEYVTYTGGLYYYDSYGTSPTGSRGPGKKVKITSINNGAPYPIHVQSSDSAYGWLKLSQLSGYKTGGLADFTGPAWLDGTKANPELVLNATDTENLLAAVGLIRDMESLLTTLNQSTVNRMTGLLNMPSLFGGISRNSDTLEQNVHIDASFPNVRDSREIEEAFNNLVNIASQRAFNTQR